LDRPRTPRRGRAGKGVMRKTLGRWGLVLELAMLAAGWPWAVR
jgi:hypothetical protein